MHYKSDATLELPVWLKVWIMLLLG